MFTQVGSLPYKSITRAMKYVRRLERFGGIPFFPELPLLGDSMIDSIETPKNLSCLEQFKQLAFSTVKIQGVGPVSLKQVEKYNGYNNGVIAELVYSYLNTIKTGLHTNETILTLDEPGMKTAPPDFKSRWEEVFDAFDDVKRNVHICGDSAPWSDILVIEWLDILNFDASRVDITIFPEYKIFRENGGAIAWGIRKESDVRDWQVGDIITPVCGIAPPVHSSLDCEKAFNLLNFVNQKMNYLHG